MNIKKKLSIFLLAFVCISTVLVGCEVPKSGISLAEEKYETDAKPKLLEMLRDVTKLDDLDIEPELRNKGSVTNPETNKRESHLEVYITFKSDKIDEYFTTNYNDEKACKLAKLMNDIFVNVNENEDLLFTYDTEEETICITFTVGSMVKINTSSGRLYIIENGFENYDTLKIDENMVYHKKHGDYAVSNNIQNSSSSSSSSSKTNTTTSYRAVTDEDILFEVWYVATEFVKDELKSPKSAEFPRCNDSSVKITFAGNSYMVTGYVDADNSFGAKIRTPFVLVLEKNGDNYKLKECTFLE